MNIDWKSVAEKNAEGIAQFIIRLLTHDGKINREQLFEVKKSGEKAVLQQPTSIRGEYLNGGIRIPGEITNSFCTLYEVGYFVNALFLNGVVSALPISEYRVTDNDDSLIERIKKDIHSLKNEAIEKGMRQPKIPIISWLTDDVETYRFRKEMLWGVKPEVSKKIIGQITKADMRQERSDELKDVLWTEEDRTITDAAIAASSNMCEAKMVQYYLALEKFFAMVGIELGNVPFYFFSSPYHELLDLGPDHEFLKLLIEMHSNKNVKIFSQLTKQDWPLFIKLPCTRCGESSKKVISGRLKGKDKKTVRLICSTGERQFKNEHGLNTKVVKGCGNVWEYEVPGSTRELYEMFKEKGFSLHVALTNLLQIFKNTAISPVAHVICDLNIYYDPDGNIKIFSPYPSGYGSSAQLFTSVMNVQLGLLSGLIAEDFFKEAKQKDILVQKPFMIIAHSSPSTLYDPSDIYEDIKKKFGIETGPQDSGIWKALENGMTPEEVITRSIGLTYYPAEKMVEDLRTIEVSKIQT
ncbi:MAG: hypothetical protein AAB798_00150 [Patescibacteria group bacterium]